MTSEAGLLSFYEATFDVAYRSAARLAWGDRGRSEDLVHDAFVRLVRAARSGAVTTVGVGWMITTVRRIHIDQLRADSREDRRLREVAATTSSQSAPTGASEIASLFDGLNVRERTVLVLRYVEDMTVDDVAAAMGISTRATESLLQRAKRKVRDTRSAS